VRRDLSPFVVPKKPTNFHTQRIGKSFEFVVENVPVVVFDFRHCGPVELNSEPSESPGEGILRYRWPAASARLGHTSPNNVLPPTLLDHTESVSPA